MVVGVLSVGILVLALLVTTSGPQVRHVKVQKESGGDIASVGQGLTVAFDRPGYEAQGFLDTRIRPERRQEQQTVAVGNSFDHDLLFAAIPEAYRKRCGYGEEISHIQLRPYRNNADRLKSTTCDL